jgi:hypothetical protein
MMFGTIVFSLVFSTWTFVDARYHRSHDAVRWTFVVFFAPVLGLLLYLSIGRDGGHGRTCSHV